jgi:2-dehydro-3-deoxyphosphogluconate aldolase / (4S)-4-hydroxy-2-oxoglutarate aldolase
MADRESVLKGIIDCGIVAVVRAESAELASKALRAALEGGVYVVEVTMTVPGAVEVIRDLAHNLGRDVILGAGTVLDPKTAQDCMDAGARFIVSPNTNPATIAAVKSGGAVAIPGALTPTEVLTAWQAGADVIKIFPGNAVGPSYIKDLHGPFPYIPFMPTGGVDLTTARDWLAAGAVALGVGGALIDKKLMAAGNFAEITARARRFRQIIDEFRAEEKTR